MFCLKNSISDGRSIKIVQERKTLVFFFFCKIRQYIAVQYNTRHIRSPKISLNRNLNGIINDNVYSTKPTFRLKMIKMINDAVI